MKKQHVASVIHSLQLGRIEVQTPKEILNETIKRSCPYHFEIACYQVIIFAGI